MLETEKDQGEYQYQAMAREIARSGFDKGVSAIMRDLMDAPTAYERVVMEGGHYDLSISQSLYGELNVVSQAEGDSARYKLDGTILFTAPMDAAVVLEDINVDGWGSGFYQISGVDRRMPSRADNVSGYQTPVPGIMTTESNLADVTGSFAGKNVLGVGSNPGDPVRDGSVTSGFSEAFYESVYEEAITKTDLLISHMTPAASRESLLQNTLSSADPGNPKIIRVQGDLYITQNIQGYGLLILEDGNLTVSADDFNWEGLILIRKNLDMMDDYDTDTTRVNLNHTTLYGGLVAYNVGTPPAVECVPEFVVEGNHTVVSDSFQVRLTVLGAAITYGGQYDVPVTARVNIGGKTFQPWGSYNLPLNGNVNTGNSGVTYTWEPDEVFPASAISVDARSWLRKQGHDGNRNSEWTVSMEKNSNVVDSNLDVLIDGNGVPKVGGFMGQYSVEDFLSDYIENGAMVLEDNESINLFELGSTNPNEDAFDMQDLVVLITLIDATEGGCVNGESSTLEFYMRNNSEIHYSSEAIAKLASQLDTIKERIEIKVASTAGKGTAKDETAIWDEEIAADDQEDDTIEGVEEEDLVTVCHKGQTKEIREQALTGHIAHGDYMGECVDEEEEEEDSDDDDDGGDDDDKTLVCHNGLSLSINLSALTAHLLHGDLVGACSSGDDDDNSGSGSGDDDDDNSGSGSGDDDDDGSGSGSGDGDDEGDDEGDGDDDDDGGGQICWFFWCW
jgi:hypothetical protein